MIRDKVHESTHPQRNHFSIPSSSVCQTYYHCIDQVGALRNYNNTYTQVKNMINDQSALK